jgi:tetratricopeptide (TPR) repeat protein
LTRPSKPAAFAALARIYLNLRNYDSAGFYANKCLQIYSNLLDYNSVDTTAGFVGLFNKEVLFHTLINNSYSGFLSYNCLIDSSLYSLYDSNDRRRSVLFQINSDNTISFRGNYNNTTDLFSGLATDEIFLIRAECYARSGNTSGAVSDINTLLQNRFITGTFTPIIASSASDALTIILIERKKELLLRGLRWEDLRRLNKEGRLDTLTRQIGGNTYTLEPNSYEYIFPIPDDVIQLTGMKQNLGW